MHSIKFILPALPNEKGVYFIGNTQFHWFKIGWSARIADRIYELSLPFELDFVRYIPLKHNPYQFERKLHKLFADHRINREWFRFNSEELAAACKQIESLIPRKSQIDNYS